MPGADIAEHLARHGLRVEVVSLPREGVTAGVAILRHAREVGAQLVVAGGYGHSRMRQLVFGGVTRHLFERSEERRVGQECVVRVALGGRRISIKKTRKLSR